MGVDTDRRPTTSLDFAKGTSGCRETDFVTLCTHREKEIIIIALLPSPPSPPSSVSQNPTRNAITPLPSLLAWRWATAVTGITLSLAVTAPVSNASYTALGGFPVGCRRDKRLSCTPGGDAQPVRLDALVVQYWHWLRWQNGICKSDKFMACRKIFCQVHTGGRSQAINP